MLCFSLCRLPKTFCRLPKTFTEYYSVEYVVVHREPTLYYSHSSWMKSGKLSLFLSVTSRALVTMNLPLHLCLLDLAEGDLSRLLQADIVVDDARLSEKQIAQGVRKKNAVVSSSSSSSSSSCFISLHSRPSLTSGGSVSRWDPTVDTMAKPCYMSPPRRPKRFSVDTILAHNNHNADRNCYSLSPTSSSSSLLKKDGIPVLPRRRSLISIPMLNRDSSSTDASQSLVRADMHEILGNALEQCAELTDYDEDASDCSISEHNSSDSDVPVTF
jgi:hypothetical protein